MPGKQPLTGDDQGDGDFRLAELVAQDDAVSSAVDDLGVEDRQAGPMGLTDLGSQHRLEPLALFDQNTFSVPRNLSTS